MCKAVLIGGDPQLPPRPPFWLIQTRALLVGQGRRHLRVTPWQQWRKLTFDSIWFLRVSMPVINQYCLKVKFVAVLQGQLKLLCLMPNKVCEIPVHSDSVPDSNCNFLAV
jgi:hypothetical protein